jgi:sugar (pentulose or hexulose) kinase
MLNIVGSSEIFVACMDRPHPDAEYYLRQHISSDRWLMLVITTAGFALEWFRSQFCQELSAKQFWQSYLPKVLQSENSTSVRFRAHLAGDRTSFQHKRASLSGLTLATTREECLSAMVRGSMVPMRRAIRKCGEFMKLSNTVAVTGGGSNPALMALKQRMFPQLRFRIVRGGSTQGAAELGRRYLRNR